MDNDASSPTCILKVDLGSSEECSYKLNKILVKLDGVERVDIDSETGLVTISGKVDPIRLIRKIAEKMEKKAKLISYGNPIMSSQVEEDCVKMPKKKAIHRKKDDDHGFEDQVPTKRYQGFECGDSNCRFDECKKPAMHSNHHVPPVNLHPPNPPRRFSPPDPYWLPPAPPNLHYPPPPPNYPCQGPPSNPYWLPPARPNLHYPPPNPYRFPPGPPNLPYPRHYGGSIVPPHYDRGVGHCFLPPNTSRFPPAPPNLHYPQGYSGPTVSRRDIYSGYCGLDNNDYSCGGAWPLLAPLPPYDRYGARQIPVHNDFTHFFSDDNAVGCTIM